MRLLSVVFVGLVAFLLNSCSDSSSPNEEPTSFTLASVDQDSVYWGDTVIVTYSNAHSQSLTLFLDSLSVTIDSLWSAGGDKGNVRFVVPVNSVSGAVKLFDQDSLAKGDHSLVVLPRLRSSFNPKAQYFSPRKAYRGDLIDINGDDLPMRWRDIHVSVGGVTLPVVSWTHDHIYARVAPGAQSGELSVQLFDKTTKIATLDILEHGSGSLLQEGHLSSALVSLKEIEGTTHWMQIAQGDTFYTDYEGIDNASADASSESVSPKPSSDSIIYIIEQTDGNLRTVIEFRLKPESENRVSGTIRANYNDIVEDRWGWNEWQVKNLRWAFEGDKYKLYAISDDVTSQVVSFTRFIHEYTFARRWVTYEGGKTNASFTVELTP